MNIRIIKAGVMDTVQDMGRYGHQHLGINPGGVMDRLSARAANLLVGNDPGKPVLELHFPASSFFFEQPALIAFAGANFAATINGDEVPSLHPIIVSKYSILQFHSVNEGARMYLAVHGGLDLPQWLGSHSTNLRANAGGFRGRALQNDDEIAFSCSTDLCAIIGKKEFMVLPWKADTSWESRENVLVLPGHEFHCLQDESRHMFVQQSYQVTTQSDRMGYQMKAAPLVMNDAKELVSSGVSFGTIQLLPSGQLILLMADHQTTGGYPRIAHVITAHHHRLGQLKPGDNVIFQLTDQQAAEELLWQQEQHMLQLHNACRFKLEAFLK